MILCFLSADCSLLKGRDQHPHPPQPLPQPKPLLPQRRSRTTMIQQLSLLPHPQPLPQPLLPQQHIRMMIQRIQLQELPPKRLVPLPHPQSLPHPQPLLHPQPQSLLHPQFVAAKSLIIKSSSFLSTIHFM